MTKIQAVCLSAALLGLTTYAHAASLTVQSRSLNAELAARAVAAAVADCDKRGYKVAAAVAGRDGNLQAFLRNPLSGPHTVLVSQRKAFTSATLQAPTGQMQSRPDLSFAPGILLIRGGVPISVGGNFYGGIAVAGADPKDDEKCAEAGLTAISEALEFAD